MWQVHRYTPKGKGQSDFSDWPLFNAGNDLRSHTLGACSTIGPAGLNFRVRDGNGWIPRGKITDNLRRLAGVNAAAKGGIWEPAAEILSRVFGSRGEGSLDAISVSLFSDELSKIELSKIVRTMPHN